MLAIETDEEFIQSYSGSPLMRSGRRGLIRNACIVAANNGAAELLPRLQIEVGEEHPFTLLADEADRWAVDVPRRYRTAGEPFERAILDAAVDVYRAGLLVEVWVIVRVGVPGYFLLVADVIQWARRRVIPVGRGRGSRAAG